MATTRRRVVIVGGGFGGLEVAKALDGVDVDVLLVDRVNYQLFQPLLYQVAMAGLSPAEIASPIRGILAEQKNVRVVLGDVTAVDLAEKRIRVEDQEVVPTCGEIPEVDQPGPSSWELYDWLVIAVGAKSSYFGHDEWEAWAPGLKSIEDALEIRRRVLLAFERAERVTDTRERMRLQTFAVIGGGPTGVELSGAIAELARYVLSKDFRSVDPRDTKVVLIEAGPRILPSFPEDLAQSAVEQLAELGASVLTHSLVVSIDEGGVELEGGDQDEVPGLGTGRQKNRIDAATVLWAAGVRANNLSQQLGVPLDRQGRILVGKDCAVPDHPDVFAIGDVAHFEEDGKLLPGVSPVAMQQGRFVARTIRWEAESDGRRDGRRMNFSYFDKGSMATIGRSRAIAFVRGLKMTGLIAWLAWLFIHVFYLIGFKNRLVVLLTWFWSYLSYERGARLITATGWKPSVPPPRRTRVLAPKLDTELSPSTSTPEPTPESVRPTSNQPATAHATR
jgi:NADH:ubiquinone reductase (H+-translocating)